MKLPLSGLEIESPQVVKLFIALILASEYDKLVPIYHCGMSSPRYWLQPSIRSELLPFLGTEGELVYVISSNAVNESSKDDHGSSIDVAGVLVPGHRHLARLRDHVPLEGLQVKRAKAFVWVAVTLAATEEVQAIMEHHRCVVRHRSRPAGSLYWLPTHLLPQIQAPDGSHI